MFIPKLEDRMYCKPWLWLIPGMLLPGETVDITFVALVGSAAAYALNSGRDTLDDIVVLRVENT